MDALDPSPVEEDEDPDSVTPLTHKYTLKYTRSCKKTVRDESIVNQFESEIQQLFDTCSEVASVYSFIARNTPSQSDE